MEFQEKIIWQESQKVRENWIWQMVLVTSMSSVAMVLGVLISEHESWYVITAIIAFIAAADILAVWMIRSLRLDTYITRSGFHYRMWPARKFKTISWNDVTQINIAKAPVNGVGKKIRLGYGKAYTMTVSRKKGLELQLKNGKKVFFSTEQPELFRSMIQKSEIQIPITNS